MRKSGLKWLRSLCHFSSAIVHNYYRRCKGRLFPFSSTYLVICSLLALLQCPLLEKSCIFILLMFSMAYGFIHEKLLEIWTCPWYTHHAIISVIGRESANSFKDEVRRKICYVNRHGKTVVIQLTLAVLPYLSTTYQMLDPTERAESCKRKDNSNTYTQGGWKFDQSSSLLPIGAIRGLTAIFLTTWFFSVHIMWYQF